MTTLLNPLSVDAKVTKNALVIIRWILSIIAITYITITIFNISQNELTIWTETIGTNTRSAVLFFLAILLMPANWGIEGLKWKLLSEKVEHTSWSKIFKGILQGITFSLLTPRRVGEFAGRVITLSPQNRIKGIFLYSAGSIAQLLVTLISGTSAIAILLFTLASSSSLEIMPEIGPAWLTITSVSFALISFVAIFTFSMLWIASNPKWQISSRFLEWIRILNYLTLTDLTLILFLSVLRYLIFVLQFYILLHAFGMNIPIFYGMALIAIIYLILALIPLSAIWDLGIRGSAAVYIFKVFSGGLPFTFTEISVLTATVGLWIINLGIPAIMGVFSPLKIPNFRQQNAGSPY